MSDPLDELGVRLGSALRRELPRVRRRRRVIVVAALLTAGIAVPATGAVTGWAGLAGGETALPTQVADGVRLQLAGARDASGPWRLDVYRAALTGAPGRVGVCVFVSRERGGSGRCQPDAELGVLADAGSDLQARVAGGIVRSPVARVEVTIDRYRGGRARTVAVAPAPVLAEELERRRLPPGLHSYAVVLGGRDGQFTGVRALAADGRTLAMTGHPGPPAPALPAHPSPILFEESSP